MIAPLRARVHDLSPLWCRLTGGSPGDFNRQLHSQPAGLNLFTARFPNPDPTGLATGLSGCMMGLLHGRFSADEIQQARMRLSQEERDGAGAGA